MTRLDELVAGITIGTKTEAAAEATFHLRFAELVELPTVASLAGEPVALIGFDALKRSGRFRVRVRTAAGIELHVALDSLDLSGSKLGGLIAAYRHWLGHSNVVLDDGVAEDVVSKQRIEARIQETREAMTSVWDELRTLNFDEIEQWVGVDDPRGRNKDYWSHGAHRYIELVSELAGLLTAIDEVAATGWRKAAAELILELFKVLEEACFECWQHYDVQVIAESALKRWLVADGGLGVEIYDPVQAVALFCSKISLFGLTLWLCELVVGVELRARDVLLVELVYWAKEIGPPKGYVDNRWAEALLTIRLEHDELDEVLRDLPVDYWSWRDMDKILGCSAILKDPQRGLELADRWLRVFEEREGKPAPKGASVRAQRRTLLSKLGRGDEAIAVLLESLRTRPNTDDFFEIKKLAEVTYPEVVEEALSLVATDVCALIGVATKSVSPSVAKYIASCSVDEMRVVSSLALEPVAASLLRDHPKAAASVYAALGRRHVDRGKPKYYHLAHTAFETARDLYLNQGRQSEWDRVVLDVVSEHRRKHLFMPGFRRIAGSRK